MNSARPVRVRFAPSPTGFLHVGGLRTALYNFLFARRQGGVFVLRIEDTDRARYVEGAVESLIRTLAWTGLAYDEGPEKGGPFGPYIQSERLDLYRDHVNRLLNKGDAYRCFCTHDRLEEMRKEQDRLKLPPKYDRRCLSLDKSVIQSNIAQGLPFVIRMRVPDGVTISFHDMIRGEVEFAGEKVDDQVLLKSDGYPTYHLANVVDDHLMQITHVIRGEEWLSSTPKHVLLYQFFGWEKPEFAHLPLLLNADRSKLSKRQGDVAVEDYREKGYLPAALVNFVALLGWNPGDERELFSLDDLVREFSIDRVGKSGAIFNVEKLDWLNAQHLRRMSDQDILALLKDLLARSGPWEKEFGDGYLLNVIRAMRERIIFVRDFIDKSPYFFRAPQSYDETAMKKRWTGETPAALEALAGEFSHLDNPGAAEFESALRKVAASRHVPDGDLIHALRLAVSGVGGGPGVFEIVDILGKDESIGRIKRAVERITNGTIAP
ncbi:MAG TPA: glutamate--tRNA ligase [Bacteroidota bacterium]|jgi:glutamyl-tRNA synthetase